MPHLVSVHLVPTREIPQDRRLCYREPLGSWDGSAALVASIARAGVLEPLVLLTEGWTLVEGFRRLQAAMELHLEEVPVVFSGACRADAFLRAVERHAGQPHDLLERVRAVAIATVDLGLSVERTAREVLPGLGLEPHPEVARRHLNLLELPAELLALLAARGLSLRRCLPFCAWAPEDARLLARLAGELRLGGRQVEQASEQLREICLRDGVTLPGLLGELEAAAGEGTFLERLERRRLPLTTLHRARLQALCRELGGGLAEVSFDRNLNSAVLELTAALDSPEALEALAARLSSPRAADLLRQALSGEVGAGRMGSELAF